MCNGLYRSYSCAMLGRFRYYMGLGFRRMAFCSELFLIYDPLF